MTIARNLRLLAIHNFLSDFRPQWPFTVIFFEQLTQSYAAAMSALGVQTLAAAIFEIPTGMLSDRIGRKLTIVVGSLFASLEVILYCLAEDIWLLYGGAIAAGVATSLFSGNNDALLYETLKAEGKEAAFHHYQGKINSLFQIALAISAFTAFFLSDTTLRLVFIVGLAPQLLACIISFLFLEPPRTAIERRNTLSELVYAFMHICRHPRLRVLTLAQSISHGVGESMFNFTTVLIGQLWTFSWIGIYRGINHLIGFIGFLCAGSIIERLKAPRVLIIAEVYWFGSHLIALAIKNFSTPLIFASGSFFFGPFCVARNKLLQEDFSDEQRATLGSVVSFTGSIVFAIAAVGLGYISDTLGVLSGIGVGILLEAFALPLYMHLFKRHF